MPRYRPRARKNDPAESNWLITLPVLGTVVALASFAAYKLKSSLNEESNEVSARKDAAAKAVISGLGAAPAARAADPGVADLAEVKKQFARVMNQATTTGKIDQAVVDWFESFDPERQVIATRLIIGKFFLLLTSIQSIKGMSQEDEVADPKSIRRCSRWVEFPITDALSDEETGEAINMRWNVASLAKDFKKIKEVYNFVKKLPQPKNITNEKTTYYWQRLFQMACLLGHWDDAIEYGKTVATFSEIRQGRRQSMMQKYHQESMINPKKYLNFLEIFKGAASPESLYKTKFDPHLNGVLRFTSKKILKFETKLQSYAGPEDREIDPEDAPWSDKYHNAQSLPKELREMWVFGAAMQLLIPSPKSIIPVCGPFNDSFIHATGRATYQQQAPAPKDADSTEPRPVSIATYKMEMLLNLVKKCPTEHPDAAKGPGKHSPWLWEGTLEIPRFQAVKLDDPVLMRPTISWTQLYKETYAVRMVI